MPTSEELGYKPYTGKAQYQGTTEIGFRKYRLFPPYDGVEYVEEGNESGFLFDEINSLTPLVTLEELGYQIC